MSDAPVFRGTPGPAPCVLAVFGFATALFYGCCLIPGLEREQQEQVFFVALLMLLVPIALATSHAGMRQVGRILALGQLVFIFAATAWETASRFSIPSAFRYPVAAAAVGVSLLVWRACYAFFCRFVPANETVLSLPYLILMTRAAENGLGFPVFSWKYGIDLPVAGLFAWFSWRAWFSGERENATPSRLHLLWVGAGCFALGMQPIFPMGESALHHWSFYLGPIELVRQGQHLLEGIPSQYGFLSVLFPASLPFSPRVAFQISLSALLAIQAVTLYSALRRLPLSRFSAAWSLLVTLAFVYWLPGDHNERGALSYPNTTAYRFGWVFLVAILLANRRQKWLERVALGASFGVGCFWSFESAAFCALTLGFSLAATLLLGTPNRSLPSLRAIPWSRLLPCLLGAAFVLAATEAAYRFGLSTPPDWEAFVEYSKAYSSRFAASPITPQNLLNVGLILLATLAVFVVSGGGSPENRSLPRYAPILGGMLATFSYYVARSEPVNLVTLLGTWLPWVAWLVAAAGEDRDVAPDVCVWMARVFFALAVFYFPFAIPSFPTKTIGNTVASIGNASLGRPASGIRPDQLVVDRQRDPALPFSNLTQMRFAVPPVSVPGYRAIPWLPAHPNEQFCILTTERRRIYLERYFQKNRPPAGEILHARVPDDCAKETLSIVSEFYEREKTTDVGTDLVLETYRRKP